MTIKERVNAFIELGHQIDQLTAEDYEELHARAAAENPWFTPENVNAAILGVRKLLEQENLSEWVNQYKIKDQNMVIGVVMAGNIPMVGFHDLLCVLISGNILKAKLSSKDTSLMRYFIHRLMKINTEFENYIILADQLKEIDAIIATGSDNSSRYFDYYFSKYPNIIRQNRTSCGILTKEDNIENLKNLGDDIFQYYGLGCRNVSKLYVPAGYNFTDFFEAIEHRADITHHHKYSNNYDYNKSIYLVNKEPHLDNGFLLLKQDKALVSPISVVFFEYYENTKELEEALKVNAEKIQCIVSDEAKWPGSFPFGQAQYPTIFDYADGIDTMKFLTSL